MVVNNDDFGFMFEERSFPLVLDMVIITPESFESISLFYLSVRKISFTSSVILKERQGNFPFYEFVLFHNFTMVKTTTTTKFAINFYAILQPRHLAS